MKLNAITPTGSIGRPARNGVIISPLKSTPPKDTVHFGSKKVKQSELKTRVINGFKKIGNEPWVMLGSVLGVTLASVFLGPIAPAAILSALGGALIGLFLIGFVKNNAKS